MLYTFIKVHLVFYLSLFNCGQNWEKGKKDDQTPIVKKAVLQSAFETVDCGNIFTAYGFRFKLTENDSSFVAIVRCPEGYGQSFFVKDGRYKLLLTAVNISDSLKDYYLDNPYKESQYPTYLLISAVKIK